MQNRLSVWLVPFLTLTLCGAQESLATYSYDALGRRINFHDPVAGVTARYYYDGRSVIEERNSACPGAGCDARVRYHVNGSQYIDEQMAKFTDAAGEYTYYLGCADSSPARTGSALDMRAVRTGLSLKGTIP